MLGFCEGIVTRGDIPFRVIPEFVRGIAFAAGAVA
jgi:hypothetical protein